MEENTSYIVITLPYREGGVSAIVRNILNFINHKELFFQVILVKNLRDKNDEKPDNFDTDITTVFEYSSLENKYFVFKRFCKIIPKNALIITNDYFELQALNTIKRKNKTIHIIHSSGEYNFENVKKYQGIIDTIVSVSKYIKNKAIETVGKEKIKHEYISQPVPNNNVTRKINKEKTLNIVFVGRITEEKGIFDLPQIDSLLKQKNIGVNWTIVGFGKDKNQLQKTWNNKNVIWKGKLTNKEVYEIYLKNDIVILPSHAEGFPVVIIEAMKIGLVPLVSDLPSGIPEIIKNGVNGFTFPVNAPNKYADVIEKIDVDRNLLEKLKENAIKSTNDNFNPAVQADKYRKVINSLLNAKEKEKNYIKDKQGFMDKPFIPNFIVFLFRKIRKK